MANDTNDENANSQNGADEVVTDTTGTDDNADDTQSGAEPTVAELLEKNKKLFERAKKAEGFEKQPDGSWVKKNKPQTAQNNNSQQSQQTSPSSVDVDERILKANGMPDELLSQLKDVAALRKISLIDAQKDPLFVAVKSQFEKEEKHKAASVGASRGSQGVQVKKTLNTPGLSRDEHRKLVQG